MLLVAADLGHAHRIGSLALALLSLQYHTINMDMITKLKKSTKVDKSIPNEGEYTYMVRAARCVCYLCRS